MMVFLMYDEFVFTIRRIHVDWNVGDPVQNSLVILEQATFLTISRSSP